MIGFFPKQNPADSAYLVTPPASNVPRHQTHIFVEHTNGIFVPSTVHEQIHTQLESQRSLASGSPKSTVWDFTDDAKDYATFVEDAMLLFKKLADMISGFACGFCVFFVISGYVNYSSPFFFAFYANFYTVVEKWFLAMCLVLMILSLFPLSFELSRIDRQRSFAEAIASDDGAQRGMDNATAPPVQVTDQRWQATRFALKAVSLLTDNVMLKMLLGDSTSPFRYLVQLRFLCYLGCLCCTIVEISVSQGRDANAIISLDSSTSARLHASVLARCGLFALAWLLGLKR